MNRKWMILGLLLLGSTLQAGGHDFFKAVGHHIPLTDAKLLQGYSITETYDKATELESEEEAMPNRSNYKEDEQYFEEEAMNIDPNTVSCSLPDKLSHDSLPMNKRKRTEFPASIEKPPTKLSYLVAIAIDHRKKIQGKQIPTDIEPVIASSSVTTLPIPPHPLVIDATQSSEQNKRPRVNFHNSDATEQPEHLSVLATNIPQLKSELECPYCVGNNKEKFKANEDAKLIQHIKNTHKGKNRFICWYEICHKRFTLKSNLTVHIKTHTGERSFTCKHCNKSFITKQNLTVHIKTHTGERPFTCTHCNKRFATKQNRTKHIRTHTGERPFTCTHCDQRFAHKSNLIVHTKIHTGDKSFECPTCEKRFTQSSTLTRHKRTHTGEKPYPCLTCNQKFTNKSNLIYHRKTQKH